MDIKGASTKIPSAPVRAGRTFAAENLSPTDRSVSVGTALVPVEAPGRSQAVGQRLARPDSSFVTHLLAMADGAPQTRRLRQTSSVHAAASYGALAGGASPDRTPSIRLSLSV